MPTLLHPRFWGAHLLLVLAVTAAALLGVWQLDVWKSSREAEARDLSNAAARPLQRVMSGDDAFPGRFLGQPVSFRGTWLPRSTLYVADRGLDGKRGYWVMTPVLVGRSAMPVVRGWAKEATAPAPSGEVAVRGWLQASEGSSLPDPDPQDDVIPEMRVASVVEHVDADVYSAYVVSQKSSTGTGGLAQVTPGSVPQISSSTSLRNLLYAIQWWIFGGFAVYVWTRWCRDQLEDPAQQPLTSAG